MRVALCLMTLISISAVASKMDNEVQKRVLDIMELDQLNKLLNTRGTADALKREEEVSNFLAKNGDGKQGGESDSDSNGVGENGNADGNENGGGVEEMGKSGTEEANNTTSNGVGENGIAAGNENGGGVEEMENAKEKANIGTSGNKSDKDEAVFTNGNGEGENGNAEGSENAGGVDSAGSGKESDKSDGGMKLNLREILARLYGAKATTTTTEKPPPTEGNTYQVKRLEDALLKILRSTA